MASVVEILIAAAGGETPRALPVAQLVAGKGIVGDRYHDDTGTFSYRLAGKPDAELTLIAREEIDAFNAATGQALTGADLRRNVVTEGVDLATLIGRDFRLGDVRLRGHRFCEPCEHLAGLVGPEVREHLVHKAGLRAQILEGGELRPGDVLVDEGPVPDLAPS